MGSTSDTMVRPAQRVQGVNPYAPARPEWDTDVRLDANEGPGSVGDVRATLARVTPEAVRRYPDARALEARIAAEWGVDAERVVVTNGGDDAIDRVCRVALEPGRTMVWHAPGFEMIERSARLAGGTVRGVEWVDGRFPREEIVEAIDDATGLVALVTPNNPTGREIPGEDLVAVVERAAEVSAIAMVDLAYAEFVNADPMRVVMDQPNVVVVRTFSKAYGLAGARVGYAVTGSAEVARWMRAVGGPFPVSAVSLALAGAALEDKPGMRAGVARVRREREEFAELACSVGAEVIGSSANFVTARFRDAAFVQRALASLGIAVRGFAEGSAMGGCLRITMPGDDAVFGRLTRSLRSACAPEAVLFDLDGVLADVSGSYRAAIVETARSLGVEVTPEDIARVKRAGDANNDWVVTHRVMASRGVDRPLEEVTARFQRVYLGCDGQPGVRECERLIPHRAALERIATRVRMGIVTGRPRAEAEWFLARAGIAKLFEGVVCMEDAPAKPSPDPVRLAMDRLGVTSAWMVGDTVDDARSARAAGVVPIGVVAPGDARQETEQTLRGAGAVSVIGGIEELEGMLP